ncbi:MAG: FecR family protein [Bacteroidetes bacterium]|nr:FecR family protein [Bacteroidota bacterium]
MNNTHLEELLNKYLLGSLKEQELQELIQLLKQEENNEQLLQKIESQWQLVQLKPQTNLDTREKLFQRILEKANSFKNQESDSPIVSINDSTNSRRRILPIRKMIAAAAILFVAGSGLVYWGVYRSMPVKTAKKEEKIVPTIKDPAPGGNKAILTMADGSTIDLDEAANGVLAQQGNTKVIRLYNGKLLYDAQSKNTNQVYFNTIATPRGGQYQLVLADGTKVWLNAASSLRFPTSFEGKERNVQLTGEAYFEVAKNKDMPFKVEVGDMNVQVLGTHFDIMGYTDENAVKTTLLEGSVKVTKGSATAMLRPGQQSSLNKSTSHITVAETDVDEAIAWKSGLFQFVSDDIGTVLRQIGRWYNIETGYEGKLPDWHFTGTISRNIPLSEVLKMLEVNEVHFNFDGKKLIAHP